MKKLLIAGGGHADIPQIEAAKQLGYYVITTGNKPDELGHQFSDEYIKEDFSDPDAMLALSIKLDIDAICACCNDFSAISASYVAEKMGLPGHDSYKTTKLLHHKDSYREFALKNDIASPFAKDFDNINSALENIKTFTFPVIVKPVDLTGGKGITKVNDLATAAEAITKAFSISREKKIVVEEFIVGSHHGFSTFLRNGKIVFFFTDNEHYYKNPYMVSGASTPSIASKNIEKKLCAEAEKIASLLTLKDGIFHIQFILREGNPVIIEICRRPPGDLYTQFVKLATGVDYPAWIIKAASGMDISQLEPSKPKGFFIRHCVMTDKTGKVKNITYDESIQNKIIDKFMWWKEGDFVEDILISKFGIIFLQFTSMDEMLSLTEQLPELIKVEVI
ncbi:MAG: ATP-grasp domain-containing protein [Methyloprofundus sp.]|nr:ATP-grasp domain-containing protein [Methyloprofundus sp.]